jgi:uncharacterized protein
MPPAKREAFLLYAGKQTHIMEPIINNALIVFAQNSEKGKVKQAIADQLGNETTVAAYKYLLQHTADICMATHCHRFVFYSDYIHLSDAFDDHCFTKFVQQGADLGEQMTNALNKVFALHHKNVCLVRSDCYELQPDHIQQAFDALEHNDVAIGPTTDGGFYLIAMKQLHPGIFSGKAWGTPTVLEDTIAEIEKLEMKYVLLATLNDIDTIEDLNATDILGRLAGNE